MRRIIFTAVICFVTLSIEAQKKSGKIIYKIANVDFIDKGTNTDVTAANDAAKRQLYQLNFNEIKSNFFLDESLSQDNISEFHNRLAKIIVSQYDYYIDYTKKTILEVSSDGTIIEKPLSNLEWEITSESKIIDEYQCFKATYTLEYLARDRKIKKRTIIAWFAPSLPFPYGPKNYYGLPGLIFELTDGDITFLISKVELFDVETKIDFPKGKTITKDEYEKSMLKY